MAALAKRVGELYDMQSGQGHREIQTALKAFIQFLTFALKGKCDLFENAINWLPFKLDLIVKELKLSSVYMGSYFLFCVW